MRKLGKLGERHFCALCDEIGLIPSKPDEDVNGWDYFVEFPSEKSSDPEKLHVSSIQVKIQVKATDLKKNGISIELSNLQNLCIERLPTFVVVLAFDSKNQPQKVYLVHLNNQWIRKVLKRIHSLQHKDPTVRLNKKTMKISYGETEELEVVSGECLGTKISEAIGRDFDGYILQKIAFLKAVGYENGREEIRFELEGQENIELFIESTTGKTKEIPVKNFKIYKKRFGKISTTSLSSYNEGTIKFSFESGVVGGSICFKRRAHESGLNFPCKFYPAGLDEFIPDNKKRLRVKSAFFDITLFTFEKRLEFQFIYPGRKRMPFRELNNAIELLGILARDGSCIFELHKDSRNFYAATMNGLGKGLDPVDLLEVVNNAAKILRFAKVDDCLEVSLDEMLAFKDELLLISSLPEASADQFKITIEQIEGKHPEQGKHCALIKCLGCQIGDKWIGSYVLFFGEFREAEEKKLKFSPAKISIEEQIVFDSRNGFDKDFDSKMVTEIEGRYPDTEIIQYVYP